MQETQAFLTLLNAATAMPQHWNGILPAGEEEWWSLRAPQSNQAGTLLRQYIGAWIDSGFQDDGSEMPEGRHYATWNCQAVFETLEPLLNCFLTIPQGPPALYVFGLQSSNCQQTPQRGALSIWFGPRGGIMAKPIVFRGHLTPEELAAFGFLTFWESPLLFRIMRCARCEVFALPKRKIRKSYVRGWHCEKCRNSAAAQAATASRRKEFRERWFALAVKAYGSKVRRSSHDMASFITKEVNKELPYRYRIKRNTISRNLKEIQAHAAKKGTNSNAKG